MQEKETLFDRIAKGCIFLGIFGVLDAILLGIFGYAGNFVKNFLLGAFGNLVYAYCIAATLASVFILLGFKPKISFKIIFNYIMILFVIICIGHLATYTEYAHLSYNEYLSQIYNGKDSLAGVVFGCFMYPFAKLYGFSMTVFSLALVGLVALAIVNQLNFEIGFKLRSFSKKKKSYKTDFNSYSTSENNNYYEEDYASTEPERELYNGDINGKLFTNAKSKSRKKHDDYSIVPIDEDYRYEEDDDSIISGIGLDVNDVKSEIQLTQQRADMFANATPIVNAVEKIQPVEEKPVEEKKDLNQVNPEDKIYFNSYRREQSLGDSAKNYGGEIRKLEDDPFDAIMLSITKSFEEEDLNKPQLEEVAKMEEETVEKEPIIEEAPSFVEPIVEEEAFTQPITNEQVVEQDKFEEPIIEEKIFEEPKIVEPIKPIDEKPQMNLEVVDTNTVGSDTYMNNQKQENKPDEIVRRPQPIKNYASDLVKYVTNTEEEPKKEEKPKPKRIIKKYKAPGYYLLRDYPPKPEDTDLESMAQCLVATLSSFKLNINIVGTVKGPTFSRIDFSLEPGTPISKLTQKKEDIKMGLAVESLRLLAPVPGKNYCGIEIPNQVRNIVGLKDTMMAQSYQKAIKAESGLTFAFGKDITGESYFYDLTKTPHLLIAGGTGSGKSVALNVLITSLMFRYSPEELRFILFDPKQVEFAIYHNIPHLLIPHILTEPKKAYSSLQWASNEMERRYSLLKAHNVRNLDEYNSLEHVKKDPTLKLPYLVIIVDEFGDVMLSEVGKSFEILIQKLAAKARAAGIHLVLATQRPTANVINGTIKTNLPCRMAFRVSSGIDSSVILNSTGAEELLGYGDMLFLNSTNPALKRVQGAFISTEEVTNVVDYVKNNNDRYFDEEIEDAIMKEEKEEESHEPKQMSMFPDELCLQALEACLIGNQVSVSYLQRKLAVGYSRGAKLVDWMMDMGYVKNEGNKKVITITMHDLEEIKAKGNGDGTIL